MNVKAQYLSYRQTGAFSGIVNDYIEGAPALTPFYLYRPGISGIRDAIRAKQGFSSDHRRILTEQLNIQYRGIQVSDKVRENIASLLNRDTYTICTAHQPNILTGHLYFIYKILHAIKLADELNASVKDAHFVPVFYMGTEDADLDELGVVNINGKNYTWNTRQKGAVGRMKIDAAFIELIKEIGAQLSVEPFGNEILTILQRCYSTGKTIEQATLEFTNELFGEFGLVVLLPDNAALKRLFIPVAAKELNERFSERAVAETIASFPEKYKVQAGGRAINLFYLNDDLRERIEPKGDGFAVANTRILFSKAEIIKELDTHPERFSPNVILRPAYQEMILPDVAFIGGGGELSYWLELRKVFDEAVIPFPILLLRNSFMIVKSKLAALVYKSGFDLTDIFKKEDWLIQELVKKESAAQLSLEEERKALAGLYDKISFIASSVDSTLRQHVESLSAQAINRLVLLEKKMLSAEKKKFAAHQRQIQKFRSILFPGNSLQERVDNLLPYYAIWGREFIQQLYKYSSALDQQFCILEEGA